MSHDAQRTGARESGFSVIEAVVALALLSIVLALMSTALNASRHALRRALAQDATANVMASMRFVEQRLADMQPLYEKRMGNRAFIDFTGEPDRVAFLTAFDGETAGGLHRVEFGKIDTAPTQVTLRMTPYGSNHRLANAPSVERLIDPTISAVEIRYFGPDKDSREMSWHESWIERSELPMAIRFEARRKGKSAGSIFVPVRPGRRAARVAG